MLTSVHWMSIEPILPLQPLRHTKIPSPNKVPWLLALALHLEASLQASRWVNSTWTKIQQEMEHSDIAKCIHTHFLATSCTTSMFLKIAVRSEGKTSPQPSYLQLAPLWTCPNFKFLGLLMAPTMGWEWDCSYRKLLSVVIPERNCFAWTALHWCRESHAEVRELDRLHHLANALETRLQRGPTSDRGVDSTWASDCAAPDESMCLRRTYAKPHLKCTLAAVAYRAQTADYDTGQLLSSKPGVTLHPCLHARTFRTLSPKSQIVATI